MDADSRNAPRRDDGGWLVLAVIAVGAACWLRLRGLGAQIVIDDEWHAIHKVLRSPMQDIVSQLDYADFSIPIAIYLRWLYDHGGISELAMRLPMALAGCALVAAAPWIARPFATLPVRVTWAVLLAVSPLLVYFGRIERPYALTALLATIAIIAFLRWWRFPAPRSAWGTAYVASTVMAGWLHLTTVAFTLMPFVFFGIATLVRRDGNLPRLVQLAAVTAVALALVLTPPLVRDWFMFTAKAGVDSVRLDTAYRTLLMLAGSAHPSVLVVAAALAAYGAVRLARRDGELVGYLAAVVLVGTAAIVSARPNWIMHPPVLARYVATILPLILLFVAEGLAALAQAMTRRLAVVSVAAAGTALVVAGPLPPQWSMPNQFTGHLRYQFDYDDAHNPYVRNLPSDPIPRFYEALGREPPGSLTLIEMPWRLESHFNPHVWYQAVHRQNVMIGLVTPTCGVFDFGEYPETERGLRLANMAHLSALLRGDTYGADYLVYRKRPWRMPTDIAFAWPDPASCLPRIEAAFGPPVYRDEQIAVFALRRGAAPH